jgi:Rrf2 family protein
MLTSLRRGSILRSLRGPRGGYQLARPPAEIRVLDVIHCLEGEASARSSRASETPEFEVLGRLEERLEQASHAILSATTLQDLLDQRDQLAQAQAMYFI